MIQPKSQSLLFVIGLAIAVIFVGLGIAVWVLGPGHGWSLDTRIIIELSLLSGLMVCLVLLKYFEAIALWILSMRTSKWLARYDWQRKGIDDAGQDSASQEVEIKRGDALRDALRERHGARWQYRDRWLLVTGDEAIVRRLEPRLVKNGFTISADTVLLYANRTGDLLNSDWLHHIGRLRRGRPVDAVVEVVHSATTGDQPFDVERIAKRLVRQTRVLRWAAPAYLLSVNAGNIATTHADDVAGCTWSNARAEADDINTSLRDISDKLADAGVLRLTQDATDGYPAELSRHIVQHGSALANLATYIGESRVWRSAIHGVLFTPLFKEHDSAASGEGTGEGDKATFKQRAVWHTIGQHSRRIHGRRVGFSFSTSVAWCINPLVVLWIIGMMFAVATNRGMIQNAADSITMLSEAPDRTQAALLLENVQKKLDTLEVRDQDGAPWYTRFGLNRDVELFAALWPSYASEVGRIVVVPVRAKLEGQLRQLGSLSDARIARGGEARTKSAYDTLKTYLMLTDPDRVDISFLAPRLIAMAEPSRPLNSSMSEGTWQDLQQHLLSFYTKHLGKGGSANAASLAILPDASLVSTARQAVIRARAIQNSADSLYKQILADATSKYPPVSLDTLLGDTSSKGLFSTALTMPGMFTREAWDERISKAIDKASEQRIPTGDWVLSDTGADAVLVASLKAELRQRYFDEYAQSWQRFLNSIRWQPARTLPGTVSQLTTLGDPQRSPLVALMNIVAYQASASTQTLPSALPINAQQITGGNEKNPLKLALSQNVPSLASAFGPLLRLTGRDLNVSNANDVQASTQTAATTDLSLARFLDRVTGLRLKLEQITMGNDPAAMSRAAAQAVLQDKPSDLTDSRDYASRVAASLGEQWTGFGQIFEQPLDQTWKVVLQPAASSLNDTWRTAIVDDWDSTFAGRYPFVTSDNDASLPEMARFMRPDNGLIVRFVTSQLAGVVERQGDQWVAAEGASHNGLALDPDFLPAINKLMRASIVLFPSGDAHVRYELRAVATPGLTDMKFVLSGRDLHYFNQKEEWTSFVWPGDTLENITHVEWQTEQGGVRSALDARGRFGLIRLLERATVTPQDSARYLLSWKPDQSLSLPLIVQLRSEAGAGPLDVLTLRDFVLPPRIFLIDATKNRPQHASASPPPLPAAIIADAKHAATPLPIGALPAVE